MRGAGPSNMMANADQTNDTDLGCMFRLPITGTARNMSRYLAIWVLFGDTREGESYRRLNESGSKCILITRAAKSI